MQTTPVAGPWITEREVALVANAVRDEWYGEAGRSVELFEGAFARYLGRRFAVSLPSCTAGIHLALLALGIGPGDEVIVPETTWIATAAPIIYLGASPVFADVDQQTWCLSAEAFEAAISSRTKAVIPVDLYGGMPEMDTICQVAVDRGIAVIEDAAEAIGSEYNGMRAGSFGDVSVFSFHGSKTLTTGEGGMLVTDREELFQRVLVLRDHGRRPGDVSFFNAEVGYKYKMSNLQAALGLAQLERVEELVARKREIFGWYQALLRDTPGLSLNAEPNQTLNSYWMTTAVLGDVYRATSQQIQDRLATRGIATRPFFHPLSSLPAFCGMPTAEGCAARNSVAYGLSRKGLNLPSALSLKASEVEVVCREFVECLS